MGGQEFSWSGGPKIIAKKKNVAMSAILLISRPKVAPRKAIAPHRHFASRIERLRNQMWLVMYPSPNTIVMVVRKF